ncbi:MAG: hypothetical protein WD851_02955 [Pirellulales bacterium]
MVNFAFPATPAELREMIDTAVEEAVDRRLEELLGDPDQGLEVREEIIERLKKQQTRVASGERGRPMEDVVRDLGLG